VTRSWITRQEMATAYLDLLEQSRVDLGFVLLSACSAGICALGFGMNSPSVIIGSMVIFPILHATISIAAASYWRDWRGIGTGINTLGRGALIVLGVAAIIAVATPINHQSEIIDRIHTERWYYFGVAALAGVAGAFSYFWPRASEAIVGIGIAVALVPPLAMTGIGLAELEYGFAFDSAVIVAVNLAAILAGSFTATMLLSYIARQD
jgi:uncharacterized membrane protein